MLNYISRFNCIYFRIAQIARFREQTTATEYGLSNTAGFRAFIPTTTETTLYTPFTRLTNIPEDNLVGRDNLVLVAVGISRLSPGSKGLGFITACLLECNQLLLLFSLFLLLFRDSGSTQNNSLLSHSLTWLNSASEFVTFSSTRFNFTSGRQFNP